MKELNEQEKRTLDFLKERGIEVGDFISFNAMYPKGFFYSAYNVKTGEKYRLVLGQKYHGFDDFIKSNHLCSIPLQETDAYHIIGKSGHRRNHHRNWKLIREYFDEEKKYEQELILLEIARKKEQEKIMLREKKRME